MKLAPCEQRRASGTREDSTLQSRVRCQRSSPIPRPRHRGLVEVTKHCPSPGLQGSRALRPKASELLAKNVGTNAASYTLENLQNTQYPVPTQTSNCTVKRFNQVIVLYRQMSRETEHAMQRPQQRTLHLIPAHTVAREEEYINVPKNKAKEHKRDILPRRTHSADRSQELFCNARKEKTPHIKKKKQNHASCFGMDGWIPVPLTEWPRGHGV